MSLDLSRVAVPHEHEAHLVEVAYDDAGHSVREFACASCADVWFE